VKVTTEVCKRRGTAFATVADTVPVLLRYQAGSVVHLETDECASVPNVVESC